MVRMATIAVLAAAVSAAWAQPAGGLQQALDRPVNLTVADAPIGEVFNRLTKDSGVRFIIDPDTLESLPYGDQTRLAVTLKNVTLRNALTPMLAPQALQWATDGEAVRIVPTEGLSRMCRRATYDELRALGFMYSAKLVPTSEGGPMIDQLRKASGNKNLDVIFHVEADKAAALAQADRALPGTAAAWLDRLAAGKNWTWYLWGDDIIIIDRFKQVQRQLQRLVSLRYQNDKLITVLLDLARKAHVELTLEAGVLNLLPIETQTNFNLIMADATVAQALEVISGATGLKFTPSAEGIRVEASDVLRGTPGAAGGSVRKIPFFVKMTVPGPGGQPLEVYCRPEELPSGMSEYIQAQKDQYLDKLKADWLKAHPATQPASAPAADNEMKAAERAAQGK